MRHQAMALAGGVCLAGSLTVVNAAAPQARDPRAIVLDMLQSPDPRQQAWGAWYAGRDNMRDLAPALVSVVEQHQAGMMLEERAATEIALDALIQLRATVAPDLLASLMETRLEHTLILASHHIAPYGDADEDENADDLRQALLTVLQREDPTPRDSAPWFAAANLLLDRRTAPPGFGRALLAHTRIKVTVFVTETGQTGVMGGSSGGVGIGCGLTSPPSAGLPPWAGYGLTRFAQRGATVLVTGPVSVYYRREVTADGRLPSMRFDDGPSLDERLQYVAKLAHVDKEALALRDHESREVKWDGAAALQASLQEIRADVQRRFARLLDQMMAAKVLDRGEAVSITPAIELDVNDDRRDKSVALDAQP